jgi:thermitase
MTKRRITVCFKDKKEPKIEYKENGDKVSDNYYARFVPYFGINSVKANEITSDSIRFDDEKFSSLLGLYYVDINDNEDFNYFINKLTKDENIAFFEEERDLQISSNDTYFKLQESLSQIDCESAWTLSKGRGIKVAVIDTGVNYNHVDIKTNIWNDNKNYGYNLIFYNSPPMDDNYESHGTHVAGIISAIQNNNEGISGVAPESKIICIKTFPSNGKLKNGYSSVVLSILFAVHHKAKIINCSWVLSNPGKPPSAINLAVDYAISKGVIFVCAAGNGKNLAEDHIPIEESKAIIVGASNKDDDDISSISNIGDAITIYAPGDQIPSLNSKDGYTRLDGTSMAAPHVSGTLALYLSLDKNKNKTLKCIKTALTKSSEEIKPGILRLNCRNLFNY